MIRRRASATEMHHPHMHTPYVQCSRVYSVLCRCLRARVFIQSVVTSAPSPSPYLPPISVLFIFHIELVRRKIFLLTLLLLRHT